MFSSAIKISSVSDFIAPSQECVIQIKQNKVQIDQTSDLLMKPDLIKANPTQKARVSLSDCLACSGCVTTAETMLIESHSVDQFLGLIKKSQKVAFGICAQSKASIAFQMNKSYEETHEMIRKFLQDQFGNMQSHLSQLLVLRDLFDLQELVQLSLEQCKNEFFDRKEDFPLICSECPGWTCYAEKTLDQYIVKHMSKVKSPQQIFGKLMKSKDYDMVACVMPCHDKKLESVRVENKQEVDLVLSTKELAELMKIQEKNEKQDLALVEKEKDTYYENNTSNGYMDYILKEFINQKQLQDYAITRQQKKNQDFEEIIIKNNETEYIFARVYGLKNITNLVNQIKTKKCKYLYVEVMACPQGCMNGGGQLKIKLEENQKQSDYVKEFCPQIQYSGQQIIRNKGQKLEIGYLKMGHLT